MPSIQDWLNAFKLARIIAVEIAEGRQEASAVKDMTDEELANFIPEAYEAMKSAQQANEDRLNK